MRVGLCQTILEVPGVLIAGRVGEGIAVCVVAVAALDVEVISFDALY